MLPKPRKGYYFPISPRRAAELTKAWRPRWYKPPVTFANPSGKPGDPPLAGLERQHDVTVYSVPEVIAPEVPGRASERALELCGELSRSWTEPKGQMVRAYLICFEAPTRSSCSSERSTTSSASTVGHRSSRMRSSCGGHPPYAGC